MMIMNSEEVERKILLVLRVLHSSGAPLGARLIARLMEEHGVFLSERTVRYHLQLMDERVPDRYRYLERRQSGKEVKTRFQVCFSVLKQKIKQEEHSEKRIEIQFLDSDRVLGIGRYGVGGRGGSGGGWRG